MVEPTTTRRAPNREPVWLLMDGLLVVALGYLTVASMRGQFYDDRYGPVRAAGWIVVLAPTALLVLRRWAPTTVLVVSAGCYLVAGIDHGDGNWILAAPFAAYMVALTRGATQSAWFIALTAVAVSSVGFYGPGGTNPVAVVVVIVIYAVGWAIGVRVGRSHHHAVALAEEARRTREHAAEIARQAVTDERARIALELHDAVGHAVNVMVMQAGAARLATSDEHTKVTLREIERVGRSALTDLDRMLGLLHDHPDSSGTPAPIAPAHGIADIEALVAGVRAGGADVVLEDRCSGHLDPVADRPASTAAFRIVQEALTNAIKHAGPAQVTIQLDCTPEWLCVSVTDDGRGSAAVPTIGGGRGLAGMRERVSVLGGSMTASPRPGGGYSVQARVPRARPT